MQDVKKGQNVLTRGGDHANGHGRGQEATSNLIRFRHKAS